MAFGRSGNFGNTTTNLGLGNNDRWLAVVARLGGIESGFHGGEIMPVDGYGIPVERLEIFRCVPALGNVSHGVESDVIGIVNQNEVIELAMTRKSNRFLGNSLLKTSVPGESHDVVVDNSVIGGVEFRGGALSGESISHGITHSLPEWSGGRFDTFGLVELRVTRSDRM